MNHSRIGCLTTMLENFIMNQNETIDQVFTRLLSLTNEPWSLGEYISDNQIVDKFLRCLLPKHKIITMLINERYEFEEMRHVEILGRL